MSELIGAVILGLIVAGIIGFMADYAITILLEDEEDEEIFNDADFECELPDQRWA